MWNTVHGIVIPVKSGVNVKTPYITYSIDFFTMIIGIFLAS